MTFKPGAFYPGKPIQPVLIRYPNKTDTITWYLFLQSLRIINNLLKDLHLVDPELLR